MKGHKTAFAALMLGAVLASPAKAEGDIGISFGYDDGLAAVAPCDYYRYYEAPPPWGLPDDYCSDRLSYDPVYYDGFWYRGPIYHRHHHDKDEVWLHGGWREDNSQGRPHPATITWQDHGGPLHGFRADFHPGHDAHGGGGEPTHVDAARGNEGPNAHGGGNPSVQADAPVAHSGDAPVVHTGGDAPAVHAGGDASSAHVSAPSSGGGESHSGGGSSSSGSGGHESSSGGGGGGSHH